MRKTRLFIAFHPLFSGLEVKIVENDYNYLVNVLRLKINDEVEVFNGHDGDFNAKITQINKRDLALQILKNVKKQDIASNIVLAFAPVKNVRIDFVAAKATEMGVGKFIPIITQHTIVDKINYERFAANIKEACEQCERNDVPQILPLQKLEKFLQSKEVLDKILILCDETHQGLKAMEVFEKIKKENDLNKEILILIGPEGGFSKEEFALMRQMQNVYSMSLGKRILRADTAMIAALALVGEFTG